MTVRPDILIADDHPLFRIALKQAIELAFDECTITEAGSIDDVQGYMARGGPCDLLLLDLQMPGARGFSGLIFLRGQYPDVPIVVVSGNDQDRVIAKAMNHGASGFIPKSTDLPQMAQAIRAILAGAIWVPPGFELQQQNIQDEDISIAETVASLTPQQFRVFTFLSEGMLNKQIAYEMDVAEGTVKAHVTGILKKFGAYSRSHLIIAAQRLEAEEAVE
ncbi:Transcriptional regulator, LuxR family [hydrothermal vent metagenome]|uniref:Transcriptional regulator, LuxR family n=1 Tax=hydrothermal vent metagenome TaxID=652676 RepID=A0A3B0TAL4_9ZZZZ